MNALAMGAGGLGITLSGSQLQQFETYYRELSDWNQRAGLTSITGCLEVQIKHFLDSLTVCLAFIDDFPQDCRLVDVGAGGGFPGLPLKLAFPELDLVLLESVGKKARFLEHVAAVLELEGVEVLTGRAEQLAHEPELRESFDLAVIRGVAKMPVLLEYTLPYCAVGGRVVALKHGGVDQEIADAGRALETLGGGDCVILPVTLDGLTDDRVVVSVAKVAPTPDQYPRRPGIPAKRPL